MMRLGLVLVFVLLMPNVGRALRACQEEQVEWDPVCIWDGPEQQKAEMIGDFLLGTPITALITLAVLRSRREKIPVTIAG